ncbi:MAG TPA: hypothetical protein EYF94_09785, partial [Porticoccaceae bacterium]|nr:hypothetical protein [Porticoccaceae bacterium]
MANYTDKLLPKLFIALPEIGKYYALTNVLQSALDEPIVMDRDVTVDAGEADNAKLNTKDFVASFYEPDKVSALDELRGLLFSSISGGLRGADIVKLVNERLGTLDEKGNEVLKVPGLIAIQSFADGAADFADPGESYPNGVVYTGDSSIAPDKSIGFTGMCKPKDSEGQLEAEEAAEAVYDTKVYNIATPESTFSKAAADGMALTVFLNAIPTIEWSSAVPYIDVQFIQEGGNNEPAARAPSIYRFLMGENMYSSELSKASRFEEVPKSEESAGSRWMSGMEVFTSPQTMVNANERTSGNKRVGGLNDGSGVIDPFRPFMSLQDLSINIYPRVNNIIFTEGTLKLKLHDKSRIGEISGFTSPQGFGKTFIIIT